MNLTSFETVIAGVFLPLVASEIFSALVRYPRLISRVENLETRRVEDKAVQTELSQALDIIKQQRIEAHAHYVNLKQQCDDDRAIARKMYDEWGKQSRELGESVSGLKGALEMLNQTLSRMQQK